MAGVKGLGWIHARTFIPTGSACFLARKNAQWWTIPLLKDPAGRFDKAYEYTDME